MIGRLELVRPGASIGQRRALRPTPSRILAWILLDVILLTACAGGAVQPVAIDTANDACHRCRMIVSDARLAAQIVAARDEPIIFDDIGCLRDYLAAESLANGAAVYVADHRTGGWVPAGHAVYTRAVAVATPMGSHLVAHASASSRDADSSIRVGEAVSVGSVLGLAANAGRLP